ncbi:MAG: FdhF/YdeP family oxidoreductase [Actinobacteria bacterium]|nr:FdhF/YdeP family oxidoreductase [Actinomycetota bacterium]
MGSGPKAAGGLAAVFYSVRRVLSPGPAPAAWRSLRSKNACKTCALGMGGQLGGMVNETGHFPEVCKKSLQALASDAQPPIPDDFWRQHSLAGLRELSPAQLERAGRLTEPMLLDGDHYRPIAWPEAMRLIVEKLGGTEPDRTFWYLSGRSSNEAAFLTQLLARDYGTNNVNNCSYYCHQASGVGLKSTIGTGTATIDLQGLEGAELVFLIGGNPASNHPRLMNSLKRIRRSGGDVIVVNPIRELGLERFRIPSDMASMATGTRIATQFLQVRSGGDIALLLGIAKAVVEAGGHDEEFLAAHTNGHVEFLNALNSTSWHSILAGCGVPRAEIEQAANSYVRAQRVVFAWTMGITHHEHGVQNVETIASLALLRGMVGRPDAGLLPIRGHSNVQGIGSVGVTPQLQQEMLAALQRRGLLPLPDSPAWDTMACMEAAHAGEADVGFCLGGNLYGSNPDSRFAGRALQRLDTIVHVNTTLNTGHAHGTAATTLILPALARDEEPARTSQESMFNYVRLSDGGPARVAGPRSESQVVVELAQRILPDSQIPWQRLTDQDEVRDWISATVPGYERLAEAGRTGREFTVAGRLLRSPRFSTADGRATLVAHQIPKPRATGDELLLMTIRSEGQFNTVVFEEKDRYRQAAPRDALLMNPGDAQARGLRANQQVLVQNSGDRTAQLRATVVPFSRIRSGCAAMYYPEANVLLGRELDPRSRTPAFKSARVQVLPLTPGP